MSSTNENTQPVADSGRQPTSKRAEHSLAHTIYGLILTLATVGELLHYEESAGTAVAWLVGAGAVLLAAHLFSDVLAHVASTRDDPTWSEALRISRVDVSVTFGFIAAASAMAFAWLADLDARRALLACVVAGLFAVAALSYVATAHHRLPTRVAMSTAAMALGAVIILAERAL